MSDIKNIPPDGLGKTNWPQVINVDLPCECCGAIIPVPFRIKIFYAFNDIHWPHYIEYKSPSMDCSTCPKCRKPFRLNRPVAKRVQ